MLNKQAIITKEALIKKVMYKLKSSTAIEGETEIEENVKIKAEFDENANVTDFKVFLDDKDITSGLTKKDYKEFGPDYDYLDEISEFKEKIKDKSLKGKQKLEFKFKDLEMKVTYYGTPKKGTEPSYWEPGEPKEIEDLQVFFGKVPIEKELSWSNKKKIEEQIWDDLYSPPYDREDD